MMSYNKVSNAKQKHYVIFVPGLGDNVRLTAMGTKHWKKHGFEPIVHAIGWRDDEKDFQIKLTRLVQIIDSLTKDGAKVSLVGCSAGGSAVLNAYIERKDQIHKVIAVCSRLKTGNETGFRSFKAKTASSTTFAQSIKLFEASDPKIPIQYRKKIMTVSAKYGDELVPAATSNLENVYNITIPTCGHVLSIALALTLFSCNLKEFLG